MKVRDRKVVAKSSLGTIERITFTSCGNTVPALLAVPLNATPQTPAVIALHQTASTGKSETMGIAGDRELSYGLTFFEAGFVVLAPDEFIAGENYNEKRGWDTSEFYRANPEWSAMGRMLEDHKAAVSALLSLRKPDCVAAVGHSLGAHNAVFLTAFDERVDVVVASSGMENMQTDATAERWARKSWFVYMPKLRPLLEKQVPRALPWDFADIVASIKPRPVLMLQARHDQEVNNFAGVTNIARESGATAIYFDGPHSFPKALQNAAASFVRSQCSAVRHVSAESR